MFKEKKDFFQKSINQKGNSIAWSYAGTFQRPRNHALGTNKGDTSKPSSENLKNSSKKPIKQGRFPGFFFSDPDFLFNWLLIVVLMYWERRSRKSSLFVGLNWLRKQRIPTTKQLPSNSSSLSLFCRTANFALYFIFSVLEKI